MRQLDKPLVYCKFMYIVHVYILQVGIPSFWIDTVGLYYMMLIL